MHNFKELKCWKKSRELVQTIYHSTQRFPKEEIFGLTLQIRRAAVLISSNIAEGCGRSTDKQLIQFLHLALGSATELENQIILAQDLKFLTFENGKNLLLKIDEVQKLLYGFKNSILKNI